MSCSVATFDSAPTHGQPGLGKEHWVFLMCTGAARGGHVDALSWLREHGCPWGPPMNVYEAAASSGRGQNFLDFLHVSLSCPWTPPTWSDLMHLSVVPCHAASCYRRMLCDAARGGDTGVISWLLKFDAWMALERELFEHAARNVKGEIAALSTMIWLNERGLALSPDVAYYPSRRGYVQILRWLKERGCEFDAAMIEQAVMSGQVEVLEWVHQNVRPISRDNWLTTHGGSRWRLETSLSRWGQVASIEWFHSKGLITSYVTIATEAASNGRIATLKWVVSQGLLTKGERTCVLRAAESSGQRRTLEWLVEIGF